MEDQLLVTENCI